MRLLWLIDSLTVGGAESLVVPFARKFRGGELTIVCMTTIGGNAIETELRKNGIDVINLGSRNLRDVRAFRRLLALARERKFALVHAHLTYASIWGSLLSRMTGIPCVASLHVAPPGGGQAILPVQEARQAGLPVLHSRSTIRDRLMRFALNRWAARVIAVSAALRDQYLRIGGIDPRKFVVVHNGIEIERFRPASSSSNSVVTVSVLRPGKGIEVLLDAVRLVPDARFLIVGDGPMRDAWTALANANGVAGRIEWAGYRNDVNDILPGCGVFVLPSLDDAFPTVLLEAMASGLPVVATRVGGIPEIVEEGVTGTLVPAGDARALADAIEALLHRATAGMRVAARRRAEERFSTEAWIARLEAVYAEVLR